MIIEEDVFLEHFGVKGMHWGVRTDKRAAKKSKFQDKGPVKRKIAGVGGVAAVGLGTLVGLNRNMNKPARAILGGGTFAAGAVVLKRLSETKMHKQVKELRNNKHDDELIRQVSEFLKANPSGVASS